MRLNLFNVYYPICKLLGVFFKYSPKRQRCIETCTAAPNLDRKQNGKSEICSLKLKLLSVTRWVERHIAISDFIKIYEAIIYCLEAICGQSPVPSIDQQSEAGMAHSEKINTFDAKSVSDANCLLRALLSDKFIVALHCNAFVSGYLKSLSVLLQGLTWIFSSPIQRFPTLFRSSKSTGKRLWTHFVTYTIPSA